MNTSQKNHQQATARALVPAWLRLSSLAASLRLRRDGSTAVGLVAILAGAAVATGVGAQAALPSLANSGAWLGSSALGMVVHVNGLSGRPDGRVTLKNAAGHPLRVIQDGSVAYVVDEVTGQVSRIDPSQLDVSQRAAYGAAGVQVVAGSGVAYVVDPKAGTVQPIDPTTLATRGAPIELHPTLGQAALDGQGTLWVPVPAQGDLTPVRGGHEDAPVSVGQPGDAIELTIARGMPVATDATSATMMAVGPTGAHLQVRLPSTMASASASGLLVPASTDGSAVPVLAPGSGALALVNTASGSVATVTLSTAGDRLGAPQVLAQRVYVPDQSTGSLIVYDAAAGQFDNQIQVTGKAGALEAFVQGGQLWVNDQTGPAALVVHANGTAQAIGKYDTQVPGPRPAGQSPAQPPAPVWAERSPGLPQPAATPSARPPAPAPPRAPGTVSAASGSGFVTVTFTPPPAASPTGYVLQGAPAGAAVQPQRVPAAGPYAFQVTGGSCGTQYSFAVVAQYPDGQAASAPTVPVQPCVAPGAPLGFTARAVNHGADLTWKPPANAAGSQVTYDLTYRGAKSGTITGLTGQSYSLGQLTNGGTYTFTLTAANGAGSGVGASTQRATLIGPSHTYAIHNVLGPRSGHPNGDVVYVRSPSASTTSGSNVASLPYNGSVTAQCQVTGSYVQDQSFSWLHGAIWDKVSGYGSTAYMSDLYVSTANSNAATYSTSELWECT